jgi:hypothetical protein
MHTRAAIFALVATACGSMDGGGGGNVIYCAAGAGTCRCQLTPISLASSESSTADCNTPGSDTWGCCYNLDSAGHSTYCSCADAAWGCYELDGGATCQCDVWSASFNPVPAGAVAVASCSETPEHKLCCNAPSFNPSSCGCSGSGAQGIFCGQGSEVTTCPMPSADQFCSAQDSSHSARFATSCAAVPWKPAGSGPSCPDAPLTKCTTAADCLCAPACGQNSTNDAQTYCTVSCTRDSDCAPSATWHGSGPAGCNPLTGYCTQ